MYIARGQGQTTPWGQNFDVNRKGLITLPICCKFQKISLKSDFIYVIVIVPGQGQTTHRGQNFDVNRKVLSLCPFFVASFKINLFEV